MKIEPDIRSKTSLYFFIITGLLFNSLFAADMGSANFTVIRSALVSGGEFSTSLSFNQDSSVNSPTSNIDSASQAFNILMTFPALPDQDGDTITENIDNCLLVVNSDQFDSNRDGFGNRCDGDLNNDGQVNILDLGLFRLSFNTSDADADFNGDGTVNILDLGLFRSFTFAQPPGPSALAP